MCCGTEVKEEVERLKLVGDDGLKSNLPGCSQDLGGELTTGTRSEDTSSAAPLGWCANQTTPPDVAVCADVEVCAIIHLSDRALGDKSSI